MSREQTFSFNLSQLASLLLHRLVDHGVDWDYYTHLFCPMSFSNLNGAFKFHSIHVHPAASALLCG